jgi:mono/diheme cytochrome c family protein
MIPRTIAASLLATAIVVAAYLALAWQPAVDPITPPDRASFDPALVRQGEKLAALGNCNVCHTAPGGKIFAGGRALTTPFGTIYSTNITPDPEIGMGAWSEAAFRRSMREGVDRAGRHLYPAFPYDHFTLVTAEDDEALYAFLMTREPVRTAIPANQLPFPYNMRILLAGWKLLFLQRGPYHPDQAQSEEWNRGAYLVEGLAHCGACHTPRNGLGAEKTRERFAGGESEGWTAYALNAQSPAPVLWDADQLYDYLRNGWQAVHGVPRGPMAAVIDDLGSADDADLRAIATYLASMIGEPAPQRRRQGDAALAQARRGTEGASTTGSIDLMRQRAATEPDNENGLGAKVYRSACAECHERGRPLPFGGLRLALSTAIEGPNPRNIINVVLAGLPAAPGGEPSPMMPGFSGALSDEQLTALLAYLRARFTDKPQWTDIAKDVRDARTGARPVIAYPSHGIGAAPADVRERMSPW